HALLGGTGLVLGVAWYLVTRPTLLEGPAFDGTSLSLPMPIEIDALVAWALAGGLMGLVTASVWRRSRSDRAPGRRGLELIELARRPSVDELLAGARERAIRTQTRLPADRILEHRNADRR
ncbi:MAG TPA: hypothetical protein VFU17_12645, partial [Candidatus Limnocylindrales bacterium]|nr:hypothetical protein [Candidatus Limnocylindrales bacterium]